MLWLVREFQHGLEHCHIDFVKEIVDCTNNYDVFLTILRHPVIYVRDREVHLQYLNKLLADLYAADKYKIDEAFDVQDRMEAESARNLDFAIRHCCLSWPGEGSSRNHQTLQLITHYYY